MAPESIRSSWESRKYSRELAFLKHLRLNIQLINYYWFHNNFKYNHQVSQPMSPRDRFPRLARWTCSRTDCLRTGHQPTQVRGTLPTNARITNQGAMIRGYRDVRSAFDSLPTHQWVKPLGIINDGPLTQVCRHCRERALWHNEYVR